MTLGTSDWHAVAAGGGIALLLLLCFAPAPAAAGQETFYVNPHLRSKCVACHVSEDDETLLNADVNALCSRCHDQTDPQVRHHPLKKVPAGMTIPKYWPLADGSITCVTCHTPGHEDDRETPLLLRDGPYEDLHTLCRACHPKAGAGARDIHTEANKGRQACLTCHDRAPSPATDTFKSVTYTVRLSILCLMCHDYEAHPSGADHCRVRPVNRKIVTPTSLDDLNRQVTCVSCHNPHVWETYMAKLRSSILELETCWTCHDH